MKVFIVAALLAVAAADSAPTYRPRPSYAPAPAYQPKPSYAPAKPSYGHQEPSYDTPAQYDFNYDVHGYGDYQPQFNAQEARDGYSTQGSYSVVLPDGRTQTVTYNTADAYSGNVAEVTYTGEAKYEEYTPKASYHPAPAYKPRYQPAPTYKATPTYAPTTPAYN